MFAVGKNRYYLCDAESITASICCLYKGNRIAFVKGGSRKQSPTLVMERSNPKAKAFLLKSITYANKIFTAYRALLQGIRRYSKSAAGLSRNEGKNQSSVRLSDCLSENKQKDLRQEQPSLQRLEDKFCGVLEFITRNCSGKFLNGNRQFRNICLTSFTIPSALSWGSGNFNNF